MGQGHEVGSYWCTSKDVDDWLILVNKRDVIMKASHKSGSGIPYFIQVLYY